MASRPSRQWPLGGQYQGERFSTLSRFAKDTDSGFATVSRRDLMTVSFQNIA
jgi:hypothetical protein